MSATPTAFTLETSSSGSDVTITLRGDLDLSTAPSLAAALTEVTASPAETVTLDLGAVSFIDSSALRVLVSGGRQLADAGKVLQIGARSVVVNRVFAMTNLDTQSESFRLLPDA